MIVNYRRILVSIFKFNSKNNNNNNNNNNNKHNKSWK